MPTFVKRTPDLLRTISCRRAVWRLLPVLIARSRDGAVEAAGFGGKARANREKPSCAMSSAWAESSHAEGDDAGPSPAEAVTAAQLTVGLVREFLFRKGHIDVLTALDAHLAAQGTPAARISTAELVAALKLGNIAAKNQRHGEGMRWRRGEGMAGGWGGGGTAGVGSAASPVAVVCRSPLCVCAGAAGALRVAARDQG